MDGGRNKRGKKAIQKSEGKGKAQKKTEKGEKIARNGVDVCQERVDGWLKTVERENRVLFREISLLGCL